MWCSAGGEAGYRTCPGRPTGGLGQLEEYTFTVSSSRVSFGVKLFVLLSGGFLFFVFKWFQ